MIFHVFKNLRPVPLVPMPPKASQLTGTAAVTEWIAQEWNVLESRCVFCGEEAQFFSHGFYDISYLICVYV